MERAPTTDPQLCGLLAGIDLAERWQIELAVSAHEAEQAGRWSADGSLSMIAWLTSHARVDRASAVGLLATGRLFAAHPSVLAAARSRSITWSQVGLLRRARRGLRRQLFDRDVDMLTEQLASLTPNQSQTFVQAWIARADTIVDGPEPAYPDRSLSVGQLDDGTVVAHLTADPALGAELQQALQTARRFDGPTDPRTGHERNADALFDILSFFNANHDRPGTPRHRPHVELGIQLPATGRAADVPGEVPSEVRVGFPAWPAPTATTARGIVLPGCATDTYLCDCVLHRVVRAGSTVLDYGRSTRTVPAHLLRAVACRDGGCRIPGCDRPVAWCDAHHIRWWRRHGETKLDNLVLLCARHHHLVHRHDWQLELAADATLTVRYPTGETRTSRPHTLPPPGDPPEHAQPTAA